MTNIIMTKSFLDTSIGYSMNMGALLLKRELTAIFKRNGFDITPEQWAVLSRLKEKDGLSQNEVALLTFKDNANITRIVDKLERKKLLERRQHLADRRTWQLFITPSGKQLVSNLEPLAAEVLEKVTKGIKKKDLKTCNRCIQTIIQNLQ
jgi:DNA-binding MarR family transcriptional regulator